MSFICNSRYKATIIQGSYLYIKQKRPLDWTASSAQIMEKIPTFYLHRNSANVLSKNIVVEDCEYNNKKVGRSSLPIR